MHTERYASEAVMSNTKTSWSRVRYVRSRPHFEVLESRSLLSVTTPTVGDVAALAKPQAMNHDVHLLPDSAQVAVLNSEIRVSPAGAGASADVFPVTEIANDFTGSALDPGLFELQGVASFGGITETFWENGNLFQDWNSVLEDLQSISGALLVETGPVTATAGPGVSPSSLFALVRDSVGMTDVLPPGAGNLPPLLPPPHGPWDMLLSGPNNSKPILSDDAGNPISGNGSAWPPVLDPSALPVSEIRNPHGTMGEAQLLPTQASVQLNGSISPHDRIDYFSMNIHPDEDLRVQLRMKEPKTPGRLMLLNRDGEVMFDVSTGEYPGLDITISLPDLGWDPLTDPMMYLGVMPGGSTADADADANAEAVPSDYSLLVQRTAADLGAAGLNNVAKSGVATSEALNGGLVPQASPLDLGGSAGVSGGDHGNSAPWWDWGGVDANEISLSPETESDGVAPALTGVSLPAGQELAVGEEGGFVSAPQYLAGPARRDPDLLTDADSSASASADDGTFASAAFRDARRAENENEDAVVELGQVELPSDAAGLAYFADLGQAPVDGKISAPETLNRFGVPLMAAGLTLERRSAGAGDDAEIQLPPFPEAGSLELAAASNGDAGVSRHTADGRWVDPLPLALGDDIALFGPDAAGAGQVVRNSTALAIALPGAGFAAAVAYGFFTGGHSQRFRDRFRAASAESSDNPRWWSFRRNSHT